ncbi:MAG: TaqI-like C-terminal specificity domain-containing protein, partial [Bacteroidota bacterium]|nr:TaqI-like C-terminal specificity domain-containing protein [Bacteroidota bacterium]
IVKFYQGIITGDNKRFLSSNKIDESYRKILRGKDISSYKYNFSENYVLFDKELLWSNTNEDFFLKDEKLINRQTGDKLVAAMDNKQFLTLDSTHVQVLINNKFSLKYVLPIFNSTLLNYYYSLLVNEGGRTFAQVKTVNLKPLPIPFSDKQELIRFITDLILYKTEMNDMSNHTLIFFMSFIDSLVFELYFPDHMREREIDVLEFVERDMYSVLPASRDSQKQDAFDTLSNKEKEAVINQLHQKWTDPNNEVVKRMAQFKNKSPDILKVILES